MIYRLIIFSVFFPFLLLGQENATNQLTSGTSNNIGDCFGAIQIKTNASSDIILTGNRGEVDDFKQYRYFSESKELNSLWFSCTPGVSGFLSITLEKVDFPFNYVAFLLGEETCASIHDGTIKPIQKGVISKNNILTFLLDSIKVKANQSLIICINSKLTTQSDFALISSFADQITEQEIEAMINIHDFRDNIQEEAFEIKIRDASTNLPVVSKVIVSETRSHNAMYMVSDFIFPHAEQLKMNLKIDASGYFFADREVNIKRLDSNELVIFLEPIERNQSIELEGLEFVSQSDVLLPFAYTKLRRLKDFMALNPLVEIEIQGHVHGIGSNSFRANRLSKKRAKKVRAYLVDSGIRKSRMSVAGFGNTKMKFPEAQTDDQIQANRRVEIRIK
jgi:outer membrane protein OmpA-like peptidoglycan-associated protein